jgi:DNA primase
MNIEQAKAIDLSAILKYLGFKPAAVKGSRLTYLSPFRNEKTPSFHLETNKNVWYDFGEGRGGTAIDFVCLYLEKHGEDHNVVDALRWLGNMKDLPPVQAAPLENPVNDAPVLELRKIYALQNDSLINYLHARGIPLPFAKRYLKEAHVRNANSGKTFFAIAIENESGGYELRNKFFKGCIAPKGISVIRGRETLSHEVHVFEGIFDFLSALAYQKTNRFNGDAIILHSVSSLKQAFPYIRNYSYKIVYSWLDNDDAGKRTQEELAKFIKSEGNLALRPMNAEYAGHKDVNAWHMCKLQL